MLATTLIVGMTFQVVVNPPGGVWDEDKATDAGEDKKKMLPGTSIMAHYYPEHYGMYMAYNSVSFFGSLGMVIHTIRYPLSIVVCAESQMLCGEIGKAVIQNCIV